MGIYTKKVSPVEPIAENKSYPPYLIIDFDEKEYDKKGKWIRDYSNMRVPFEELADPRNEKEKNEYIERSIKEIMSKIKPGDLKSSFTEDGITYYPGYLDESESDNQ